MRIVVFLKNIYVLIDKLEILFSVIFFLFWCDFSVAILHKTRSIQSPSRKWSVYISV